MINMDSFLVFNGKSYGPVDGMKNIVPYRLMPDISDGSVPFTVPAAPGGPLMVKFKCPSNFSTVWGTPIELTKLVFAQTGGTNAANMTVRLRMMSGRDYMVAPVHVRTLFGWTSPVGHLPSDLREPLILFSDEYILGEFRNIGGLATTIYPILEGCQYYPLTGPNATPGDARTIERLAKWRNRYKTAYPFWLTTDAPIVHSGGDTVQSQIKIADCAMELFTVTAVATGNFQLEIKEVVSGKLLMNGQITLANALGDATLPTVFPFSYVLPPGAILRLTTTDLSGNPNTIWITMQGRKLFAPIKTLAAAVGSDDGDIGLASDYERNLVLDPIGANA